MEETATVMGEATAVMKESTAVMGEATVEAATDRPTPTKIPTEEPALPEALATPRSSFFVKSDTPEAIPTPKPQLEELEEDEPLFPSP